MPPVVRAESSEESVGVCLHGVSGHGQFTTDCPVGQAPADSLQDLKLSFGRWVEPCVRGGTHRACGESSVGGSTSWR